MLDRYVSGSVTRLSPEAPVPVLNRASVKEVLGGSGNVAGNIVSMGGLARLISLTGQDDTGKKILSLCDTLGIDADSVLLSETAMTTVKTRFLSGAQQILRLDDEDLFPLTEAESSVLLTNLRIALADADCLVLSDYNKGVFKGTLAKSAIQVAQRLGRPVIVDPKGQDYEKYRGATLLTPNLKELCEAAGRALETDADIVSAARELLEKYQFECICATRSENGMSIVTRNHETHIKTYAREVFDVSGAGDTVIAAFAIGLARGMDPDETAYIANIAASLAVSKLGTVRISTAEILGEMQDRNLLDAPNKVILSAEEMQQVCKDWKALGLTVGLTNGCFDILHIGHVTSLNKARQHCDKLIIALNSDTSVGRLKGKGRPVHDVDARAGVLAGLRAVDAIVVFEEDTPLRVIQALMPDKLFKGKDYTIETVIGAQEVIDQGGEVILIDFVAGHSTSNLIQAMTKDP